MLEALPGGPEAMQKPNAEGKTPLMMACCMAEGGSEAAQFLLEHGANPAAADNSGNTPIHLAAIAGNEGVLKLLLARQGGPAPVRAANARGHTPLHLAAAFGHEQVVRELMGRKVDLKAADQDGCTPLHMLCKSVMCSARTQASLAQLMLSSGADPAAKDVAGCSCIDYASTAALQQLLNGGMASTSGGATAQQPAGVRAGAQVSKAASKKGQKLQAAMQQGLAAAGVAITIVPGEGEAPAAGTDAFLIKEALRQHTSEEPDGWKLGAHVSQ